jgi:hypothetical protein
MSLTSSEILCEACLDLLGKHRFDQKTGHYTHHSSADTFDQALKLRCAICIRIYMLLQRWDISQSEAGADDLFPFSYSIDVLRDSPNGGNVYELAFTCTNNGHLLDMTFEPYNGNDLCPAAFMTVSSWIPAKPLSQARLQQYFGHSLK